MAGKKYLHMKLFFTGGRNGGKVGKMSMEAGDQQNRPEQERPISTGNRLVNALGKGIVMARRGSGEEGRDGRGRGERGVRCEQCGER